MPGNASVCCSGLYQTLGDIVWFPGSDNYTASLSSYFAAQQGDLYPECIVYPRAADHVATALHVLTTTPNTATGCQFAVRSGGHSFTTGASNIETGVTVDLRGLNSIELDQDSSTVSIGVGSAWDAVYSQLDPFNLTVAGARAPGVGVGGLTTGGGLSWLGPRYGFTCDTVKSFEIVLSNGSVVNANVNENPELSWALHGGSNNYGIVTRIDFETLEQGSLWGGVVQYDLSTSQEQITALSSFSNQENYDVYSSLQMSFAYSGAAGAAFVVNTLEYTKPVVNPPVFQNLSSIKSLASTMRLTNMTDLALEVGALQGSRLRYTTGTLTIEPTLEALNIAVQSWNSSLSAIRNVSGITWSLNFDPLPKAIYDRHAENNALGLTERDGKPLLIILLTASWSDAQDDEAVAVAVKSVIKSIQEDVGELGALDPYLYLNYAAQWQDPIAGYGSANVEKLVAVQEKYDPHRVFTDRVPGCFKLPRQPPKGHGSHCRGDTRGV